ncbi:hypothetical protein BDZ90DRAFT_140401 [Jaminaea rosea]|uniref:Uncharacterized protein n=1 Tax=Jaminaea rosea TaxID=1569628 RepID=A0A316UWI0_9BASI|nr:hypothetical protein BDZ90DRAFT_140401 [Jaminaea rosea]PWN29158.1 hypothetical protein BDZ90DRAFT_140401 [Jaminaea rosea]
MLRICHKATPAETQPLIVQSLKWFTTTSYSTAWSPHNCKAMQSTRGPGATQVTTSSDSRAMDVNASAEARPKGDQATSKVIERKRKNRPTSYIAVVAFLLPRPAEIASTSPALASKLEKLDAIRKKWDAAEPRWVPHLTLIPPFIVPFEVDGHGGSSEVDKDANGVSGCAADVTGTTVLAKTLPGPSHAAAHTALHQLTERIQQAVAAVPRHRLVLDDVGIFKLSKYSNVHLRPRPRQRVSEEDGLSAPGAEQGWFIEMQRLIQDALPETRQAGRGSSRGRGQSRGTSRDPGRVGGGRGKQDRPFAPHASLGQAHSEAQLEELKALGFELCTALAAPGEGDRSDVGTVEGPANGTVAVISEETEDKDVRCGCGIDIEVTKIALMAKPQGREGRYDVFSEITID